jgi:hypothetical protein
VIARIIPQTRCIGGERRKGIPEKWKKWRVSVDVFNSQPAQAYYTVRIGLPADQVARLKDIRLVPGMPVEAFIQTPRRCNTCSSR